MIISLYLYPQLAGCLMAIVSLLCGLRWPKLDFENDSQVFKNSAGANLPVLFVFLPSFIIMGANTYLSITGMQYNYLFYVSICVISLIYIILIIIMLLILKKKGIKLFDRIIMK